MNGKVVHVQSGREGLSPAESSSGGEVDEVHPGADPVSVYASAGYVARVKWKRGRADGPFRRVEPRIISSLRDEIIRFFLFSYA